MNNSSTQTALQQFSFESQSIRIISDENGAPWFIAKDVASLLGYANTRETIIKHCKKSKSLKDIGVAIHDPYTNQQLDTQTKAIPESDVYRLIMRSNLESADKFQEWVCDEVLPAIRKTGSYSVDTSRQDFNNSIRELNPSRLAKTHRSMLAIAKLNGLKGNQAIISADRATTKLEGHSTLALLGIDLIAEVKEKTLNPTEIGMQLGNISAQSVNKMLKERGYQISFRDCHNNLQWDATDKGKPYGEMADVGKKNNEGAPIKQWRWYSSIIEQLKSLESVA
jgi:prophage antirepressor-like protein